MKSIIAQKLNFFKLELLERYFWGILAILLILGSFFVGRITKFMEQTPAFSFESQDIQQENYNQEKDNLFGRVATETIVASKGGKKYYFVWCKGAGNIKDKSKRYFATEELAHKAGYTLANNCK
jgi:hypothetical protein